MSRSRFAAGACGFALLTLTPSLPVNAQGATIGITAEVPTICRVGLEPAAVGAAARLVEFCNSAGGYDVVVDHDPATAGSLVVDGQSVALSPTGSTILSSSPGPEARVRQLILMIAEEKGRPLAFRIVPRA